MLGGFETCPITGRSRWNGVEGMGGVSSSATGAGSGSWFAGGVSGGVRGGASLGFNVSPWGCL